jgi:hypothetical protein
LDKDEKLLCLKDDEDEEELIVSGVSCQGSCSIDEEKLFIVVLPEGSLKNAYLSTSSFCPYTYLFLFYQMIKKTKENQS